MNPTCIIDGCDRPVLARNWCNSHYNRWYRHGDPLAGRVAMGVPLATLRKWVSTRDRSQCWPWPYGQNGVGYGVVKFEGRYIVATQVALTLDGRPAPDPALHALHACDNPPCVNPAHLEWGTPSENMQQCHSRGRWTREDAPKGEASSAAKLKEDDVREIRRRSQDGESLSSLSTAFRVGKSQVRRIIRRESWAHVE